MAVHSKKNLIEKLHAKEPCFSFEFFPPKTETGMQKLWDALIELKTLEPTFVSVTYGAGGSTQEASIDLSRRIQSELGLVVMAHLTCVGASQEDLRKTLSKLKEFGVENIIALRGDPPKDAEGKLSREFVPTQGGFRYASELVAFASKEFDFCIAGACYPEKHIEAVSLEVDIENLKKKVDAGTEFLITQLFFDNQLYFDFVDRLLAKGINIPVLPGIMPVTNLEQVKRFTSMCGASIPSRLLSELERRAGNPQRIQELGIVHATIQSLGLIQGGAPGVHFYTLNQSPATREIVTAIRLNARI